MRDYLAIPSLYYDSTDKLFVVPEGRTKNYVAFQAELRRRMENEERLRSGQTLQREDTIVLFLAFSISPSASLLLVPSRVESELTARDNRVAGIFTATMRVMSTDRITEKTSRAEMPTRYCLRNPASVDVRGICELQAMFVSYHALSQSFEQL